MRWYIQNGYHVFPDVLEQKLRTDEDLWALFNWFDDWREIIGNSQELVALIFEHAMESNDIKKQKKVIEKFREYGYLSKNMLHYISGIPELAKMIKSDVDIPMRQNHMPNMG